MAETGLNRHPAGPTASAAPSARSPSGPRHGGGGSGEPAPRASGDKTATAAPAAGWRELVPGGVHHVEGLGEGACSSSGPGLLSRFSTRRRRISSSTALRRSSTRAPVLVAGAGPWRGDLLGRAPLDLGPLGDGAGEHLVEVERRPGVTAHRPARLDAGEAGHRLAATARMSASGRPGERLVEGGQQAPQGVNLVHGRAALAPLGRAADSPRRGRGGPRLPRGGRTEPLCEVDVEGRVSKACRWFTGLSAAAPDAVVRPPSRFSIGMWWERGSHVEVLGERDRQPGPAQLLHEPREEVRRGRPQSSLAERSSLAALSMSTSGA